MSTSRPKQSHARKQPDGHIRRPRNAFILYRSDFVAKSKLTKGTECDHRKISKIVGQIWNNLSADEKAPWEQKALEEKEAHRLKYPDYRYTPQYSRKPGDGGIPPPIIIRRKPQNKPNRTVSEDARCKRIAKLVLQGKQGEDLERAMADFDSGLGVDADEDDDNDEFDSSARLLKGMISMAGSQSPSPPPSALPLLPPPAFVHSISTATQHSREASGTVGITTRRRSVSTPTPVPAHLLRLQPAASSAGPSRTITRPSYHVRASSTDEYIPRIARSSRPNSPLVGAPRNRKTRTLAVSMREAAAHFTALSNAERHERGGESRHVDRSMGLSLGSQMGDVDFGSTSSSSTFTSPRSFKTEDLSHPDHPTYSTSSYAPYSGMSTTEEIAFPSLGRAPTVQHQYQNSQDVSIPFNNTHITPNAQMGISYSHSTTQDMHLLDTELQRLHFIQQHGSGTYPESSASHQEGSHDPLQNIISGPYDDFFGVQCYGKANQGLLGMSFNDEAMFGIDGEPFSICNPDFMFPEPFYPPQSHLSQDDPKAPSPALPSPPSDSLQTAGTDLFADALTFTFPTSSASPFPAGVVSTLDTTPMYKHPLIFTQPLRSAFTTAPSSSCPSDWLGSTSQIDWDEYINGEGNDMDGEGEPESVVQDDSGRALEDRGDLGSYRLGMELAGGDFDVIQGWGSS